MTPAYTINSQATSSSSLRCRFGLSWMAVPHASVDAYSPNDCSPSIARKGRGAVQEEDCSNLNTFVGRAEDRPVRLVDEALSLRTRRRATLSSFDQDEADTLHRWRRQKMGKKVQPATRVNILGLVRNAKTAIMLKSSSRFFRTHRSSPWGRFGSLR